MGGHNKGRQNYLSQLEIFTIEDRWLCQCFPTWKSKATLSSGRGEWNKWLQWKHSSGEPPVWKPYGVAGKIRHCQPEARAFSCSHTMEPWASDLICNMEKNAILTLPHSRKSPSWIKYLAGSFSIKSCDLQPLKMDKARWEGVLTPIREVCGSTLQWREHRVVQ